MFEIRLASSDEDLERLYRFRYSIYVEEMNRVQHDANHERKWIRDDLDNRAHNLLAFKDGELVGAIRINLTRDGPIPYYTELYQIYEQPEVTVDNASIVTRLMILSKLRRSSLALRLCSEAYEFGLYRGIRFNFIDCNYHLVKFFESFGWKHYIGTAVHKEYGEVHPMILDLYDEGHFMKIDSPYLPTLIEWKNRNTRSGYLFGPESRELNEEIFGGLSPYNY